MKTPHRQTGRAILPPGEVRCVWMSAGLISWRLCRRGLDCEGCLLDRAMREAGIRRPAGVEAPSLAWVFPEDRRYAPFHTWARTFGGDRLQVGADVLASELMPSPTSVSLPPVGASVEAGTPSVILHTNDGDLELSAPVSGKTVRTNTSLEDMPELVKLDPYGSGWLIELEPSAGGHTPDLENLVTGSRMRQKALLDAQRFQRQVATDLLVGSSGLGPTLADGGEPILDLRLLLGSARHLARVQELLR